MIPYCGRSLSSLLAPRWCVRVMPGFWSSLTSAFSAVLLPSHQRRRKIHIPLTIVQWWSLSIFFILFFISLLMITSLCALILHSYLPKIYLKKTTHLNLSFRVPIWISHLIRRIGFVWATPSCLNSWGQIGSSSAFGFICALSSRMNSYLAGNNVNASNEENGHHVPLRLVNGHFRLPQFSYA